MLYRLHCPKGYAVRVIRVVVSLLDRLVGQSGWTYERLVGRLGGKGNDVRGTSLHELLGCPILKLYSRRTLMPILSSFESISLRTEQPGFSRLWDFVPAFFRWQSLRTILLALDKVCAVWGGFYWVVEARKARG
jgi:hypothetical protein